MPPREDHAWENLAKDLKELSLTKPQDSPSRGTIARTIGTTAGILAFTAVATAVENNFKAKFIGPTPAPTPPAPAPSTGSPTTATPTTGASSASPSGAPSLAPSSGPSPSPSATPSEATPAPSGALASSNASEMGGRALRIAGDFADNGGFNAAAIIPGVIAFVVVEHFVTAFLEEVSERLHDDRRAALGLPATYSEQRQTLPTAAADAATSPGAVAAASPVAPPASPAPSVDSAIEVSDDSPNLFASASSRLPPVPGSSQPPIADRAPAPMPTDIAPLPESDSSTAEDISKDGDESYDGARYA